MALIIACLCLWTFVIILTGFICNNQTQFNDNYLYNQENFHYAGMVLPLNIIKWNLKN